MEAPAMLLRRPLAAGSNRLLLHSLRQRHPIIRRLFATNPTPPTSRLERFESRLPRFLQRIVTPVRNAPVSHISAFLILHEITAIVPLFGLAAVFHYADWLPPFLSEGKWVSDGTQMFGRWLRKRGWISKEDDEDAEAGKWKRRGGLWYGRGEGGVRIVVELATAWALVKMLLPLRLVISVWGTPWFARWTVLPFMALAKRMFGRGKAVKAAPSQVAAPAAGTGAVGGGVLPQQAKPK